MPDLSGDFIPVKGDLTGDRIHPEGDVTCDLTKPKFADDLSGDTIQAKFTAGYSWDEAAQSAPDDCVDQRIHW